MFIRSMRLTAPTVCTAGLLAVLMTVGAPSIASDNQSRTEAADQPEIAQMTLGQGFIDFGININAEKSILRISGPAGYALTLRNQKPAAVTADLLMDAKPPRGADESPSIPDVWHNLPDGTYVYELVLFQGDGSQEVKSGSFKVVNGQPLSKDENAQPAESGEGHSSNYEPNWIERVASATLDFLVPSAHAGDSTNDFYDIFDGAGNDFTDITLHNTNQNNVAMFNEGGELKFGTGTAGSDDVLMTFSSVLGKVGIHTEAPQEVLHIVGPLDSSTANIKIENSGNAFTLATGSTSGFRIRQSEPTTTTPFQIEPGAPTGSFLISASGDTTLGGSVSVGGTINSTGDITVTNTTPSITFDNTSGDATVWRIGESNDDLNFNQTNGTNPGTHLHLEQDGNVGIGTTSPGYSVHAVSDSGLGQIRVTETNGSNGLTMFALENTGHPRFRLRNSSLNSNWDFRTAGSDASNNEQFQITNISGGESRFLLRLFKTGDLEVEGDVTANGVLLTSSRATKTDFAPLDENEVLDNLSQLEISKWRYKHENEGTQHFGPIAEEFHEIFGLSDGKHLNMIDVGGIAFAAIQALNNKNTALEQQNEQLMERLDRLEQAIQ